MVVMRVLVGRTLQVCTSRNRPARLTSSGWSRLHDNSSMIRWLVINAASVKRSQNCRRNGKICPSVLSRWSLTPSVSLWLKNFPDLSHLCASVYLQYLRLYLWYLLIIRVLNYYSWLWGGLWDRYWLVCLSVFVSVNKITLKLEFGWNFHGRS